jgi:hypothetical protein
MENATPLLVRIIQPTTILMTNSLFGVFGARYYYSPRMDIKCSTYNPYPRATFLPIVIIHIPVPPQGI